MAKYCSYCGNEIDENAEYCSRCGEEINSTQNHYEEPEKKKFSIGRVVLGVVLGGFLLFYFIPNLVTTVDFFSGTSHSSSSRQDYITLDEFNRIENGMSYQQVRDIIGSEGTVMSESEVMDTHMIIYYWYGKNGVANANFTFSNDELINKTQIGLE